MSQLEDSPSALLRNFGENLLDQVEEECRDSDMDLPRGIVSAVRLIVLAAADTAEAIERQGEQNESA